MNVYVETNFILELVFMQEEQESCDAILKLCELGKIKLIIPAFSLIEPYETLIRHDKERRQLADKIRAELRQLGRSKVYTAETEVYEPIIDLLIRSGVEETQRLEKVQQQILSIAEIIPLDVASLALLTKYRANRELSFKSPQDTLVYAQVIQHLDRAETSQSCFLNKNIHDFAAPDIEKAFTERNCKILYKFQAGYNYLSKQS